MTHTDEELESIVQFELEHGLYYLFIEWPQNPVPAWYWRDAEGKIHSMDSMGLDHLKASSRLVEKSLKHLLSSRSGPKGAPTRVTEALEPYIRAKLLELKATLREKVDS